MKEGIEPVIIRIQMYILINEKAGRHAQSKRLLKAVKLIDQSIA
jgi:hypothetical protein